MMANCLEAFMPAIPDDADRIAAPLPEPAGTGGAISTRTSCA